MLQLLGPTELTGTADLPAWSPRQRLVLAALAVDAGRPVPVAHLVDRVWGTEPPPEAHRTLQAYIARCRRILAQAPAGAGSHARVERRGGGYQLQVDPEWIDLHRFRRLVVLAREPACPPQQRIELLREATGLWRGQPLAGLSGPWVERTRHSWRQEQITAVVAWAEAELAAGDPQLVLGPVTDLTAENPWCEPLFATIVRIMGRLGRTGEALRTFQEIRHRLADELGVDPGSELRAAHQAVLRGDVGPTVRRDPVPAQLPLNLGVFAGRIREIAALDRLLASGTSGETVLAVLSGPAGVGKSALAVHWAHRVAERFPDGQLFVNLRAFDPDPQGMEPAEAIRRFLEALGVPSHRIPADDLDAQSALYRSTMAGRRMLIVLDNARAAEQIRPLLPGAPGSLVVVTSRNQLTGLLARDGGHLVTLDLLPPAEATQMLIRRLGEKPVQAQPQAVSELITSCGRLPLALAIVAARAAVRPGQSLAELVESLNACGARLDALTDAADPSLDVRSVFSWSYRDLPPPAARLFRMLGLHPGAEFSLAAAASLAGAPAAPVRVLLDRLVGANLLAEPVPGWYALHDLLRAYATDLAHQTDDAPFRAAATGRLLDHYLHTAHAADRLLYPARIPPVIGPADAHVTLTPPADQHAAVAFLNAHRAILVGAVQQAAADGFHAHATYLAWTIADYLDRLGHWHDLMRVQATAATAASRLGDVAAEAEAVRLLARAHHRLGHFDHALEHLQHALDLAIRSGDLAVLARTQHNLAMVWDAQGRVPQALYHVSQAREVYRKAGDQRGEALTLNGVGWCQTRLGDHVAALTACGTALVLLQTLGDRPGQADAWDSLGHVHHHLGDHAAAVHHYSQAVRLNQDLGHRYREADTLTRLAESHQAGGNTDAAREAWQRALTILTELEHPDIADVRLRLAASDRAESRRPARIGETAAARTSTSQGTSQPPTPARPAK